MGAAHLDGQRAGVGEPADIGVGDAEDLRGLRRGEQVGHRAERHALAVGEESEQFEDGVPRGVGQHHSVEGDDRRPVEGGPKFGRGNRAERGNDVVDAHAVYDLMGLPGDGAER